MDFVACGRCSYFLAGYRAIHGRQGLEDAIAHSDGEWLTLQWNEETSRLVQKSYGCRMDMDWYLLESCCPICCRRFEVSLSAAEDVAAEQTLADEPDDEVTDSGDSVPENRPIENRVERSGHFRVQLIHS